MSPEIALLHDVWDTVKPFVNKKEKLQVAENIVRAFDDNVDLADIDEFVNEFDSVMKAAIISHFDIATVKNLDDDDDDDDDIYGEW